MDFEAFPCLDRSAKPTLGHVTTARQHIASRKANRTALLPYRRVLFLLHCRTHDAVLSPAVAGSRQTYFYFAHRAFTGRWCLLRPYKAGGHAFSLCVTYSQHIILQDSRYKHHHTMSSPQGSTIPHLGSVRTARAASVTPISGADMLPSVSEKQPVDITRADAHVLSGLQLFCIRCCRGSISGYYGAQSKWL
jgi:hypothetical protein